jgi:hypothetical protein
MRALRQWYIAHGWFIIDCDPSPMGWLMSALSPDGRLVYSRGTEDTVKWIGY